MTPEHDIELLREQVRIHGERLAALEVWWQTERTKHASTPTWLFGVISAAVSVAMLLLNLYLAGVR